MAQNWSDIDKAVDPVHEHEGQWYFWDEAGLERIGPFTSRENANRALNAYHRDVLGDDPR